MNACSDSVTVSVRYRPGNLETRPPIKVVVDGKDSFSLSKEGVKRITLAPGMHDFRLRCRFEKEEVSLDVKDPTRITIGFCGDCGRIRAKAVTVGSEKELDYERIGY